MTDRIAAAARDLTAARRAGRRIRLADPPRDIEEAFAVQDRVVAELGEPVIGWKMNELPQGVVVFAPVLAGGLVPAGGTWTVPGSEPAGIELEIAFRMARDVPPGADAATVLDCIGSAHVVFELCQSRNADPDQVPRHVALADCILNSGIVVGPSFGGWRDRELKGIGGRLLVDGQLLKDGRSVDPIREISVLPAALEARGKSLRAGHVVITGSLIGINWLNGRRALRGEIDGCGVVEANVAAA